MPRVLVVVGRQQGVGFRVAVAGEAELAWWTSVLLESVPFWSPCRGQQKLGFPVEWEAVPSQSMP